MIRSKATVDPESAKIQRFIDILWDFPDVASLSPKQFTLIETILEKWWNEIISTGTIMNRFGEDKLCL